METKNFELKGFTKITVGGAFNVDITRADSFKVSVASDDFSHTKIEENNGTLVIKHQGIDWLGPFHKRPQATVTLPSLTELNISGASTGKFQNFQSDGDLTLELSGASQLEARTVQAGKLTVKVSGASTLTGDVKTIGNADIEVSGASKVEFAGAGTQLEMKVNGSSKVELGQFPVRDANLKISGASHVFVNLNGKLDANVSGASSLLWSGTPVMGDIQTSGASKLQRK